MGQNTQMLISISYQQSNNCLIVQEECTQFFPERYMGKVNFIHKNYKACVNCSHNDIKVIFLWFLLYSVNGKRCSRISLSPQGERCGRAVLLDCGILFVLQQEHERRLEVILKTQQRQFFWYNTCNIKRVMKSRAKCDSIIDC